MLDRPRSPRGGAVRRARPALRRRVYRYWLLGVRHALAGLGQIARRPLASAMTVGVIGIALALPAGLYLGLVNLEAVTRGWHDAGQATLFMERDLAPESIATLAETLRARDGVAQVTVMSAEDALAEFRRLSGFDAALTALPENPLPAVLLVTPAQPPQSPAAAAALVAEFETLNGVDMARFDVAWLMRFQALLDIARRVMWVSAALLLLAVLLAVGNTIRLDIENRRAEIEITQVVGATDRFIRRPFLYGGFWYGLLGGVLAGVVVSVALWLISGPVEDLARAYHSDYRLTGPGFAGFAALAGAGAVIGWSGAWLAVSRHLKGVEPG